MFMSQLIIPSQIIYVNNILVVIKKITNTLDEQKPKFMYIMGLHGFANHDSGACIVKFSNHGMVDFIAISEERLIRKKYPYSFPIHSIAYCMEHYGLDKLSQIDLIVTDYIRLKRWFSSGPAYNVSEFDYLKIKLDYDPKKIILIDHHLAHAASVFYTSGFDESSILIIDGNGSDLQTTSYLKGQYDKIDQIDTYKSHGIGTVYSVVTKQILNLGVGGEGKTMGLAPYGAKFPKVLDIPCDLDGIKNNFSKFVRRLPFSDVLNQVDGKNRINPLKQEFEKCLDGNNLLNPYFSRVAFDVQEKTEEVMIHLGKNLFTKNNSKNLCVAGGVALNSVANQKMFNATDFEKIHIFPACSDAGIPFGLAIWGYYNAKMFEKISKVKLKFSNAYTGKEYSDNIILDMFHRHKISFKKTSSEEVAKLIADGKIIGWFQGGSEYGPRALGHRSILADSRREEMKNIINDKIKHRESFRPFAPAVLLENCTEYFELDQESPYMLLVANVKKPKIIPSITHVDGTARVQTLTKEDNGKFYDLVNAFKQITGVPVILNTSFNDAGEPIVETPEDAMICFLNTEIDYLVLGDYIVNRSDIDEKSKLLDSMQNLRKEKIQNNYEKLIKELCPGFDKNECVTYVNEHNKMALWHTQYRSKYELEKKVLEWIENKSRIMIIGTKEHTRILLDFINGFNKINVVGFAEYTKSNSNLENFSFDIVDLNTLQNHNFDEILISSYEYMYEIEDMLEHMKNEKCVYSIYDNASRSFEDVLTKFPKFKNTL
jgi:carbamoyltransferase